MALSESLGVAAASGCASRQASSMRLVRMGGDMAQSWCKAMSPPGTTCFAAVFSSRSNSMHFEARFVKISSHSAKSGSLGGSQSIGARSPLPRTLTAGEGMADTSMSRTFGVWLPITFRFACATRCRGVSPEDVRQATALGAFSKSRRKHRITLEDSFDDLESSATFSLS